jgi:hypothetical protein
MIRMGSEFGLSIAKIEQFGSHVTQFELKWEACIEWDNLLGCCP